jgi:ABC-type uncharacterized transport system ATPase subunit
MPLNNLQSSLPSDSSAVIEFRKVNKWFGSLHVLKDIDLSVEAAGIRGLWAQRLAAKVL